MQQVRVASVEDIEAMSAIRMSVRENALQTLRIARDDYVSAITAHGRGWVCEIDGEIVGFSVGLGEKRNLWALFVRPGLERRGIGLALARAAFDWFHEEGVEEVTFTTQPATRADAFYQRLGCERGDLVAHGEVVYRWRRKAWTVPR